MIAQPQPLPGILQEIAEVAGREAAMAIGEAKGGQQVFIVARLKSKNWLVRTVGAATAEVISRHFTSGNSRQKLIIPAVATSVFLAEKQRRDERIVQAIMNGGSANQIACACGVTTRTVHRWRRHLRRPQLQHKAVQS